MILANGDTLQFAHETIASRKGSQCLPLKEQLDYFYQPGMREARALLVCVRLSICASTLITCAKSCHYAIVHMAGPVGQCMSSKLGFMLPRWQKSSRSDDTSSSGS